MRTVDKSTVGTVSLSVHIIAITEEPELPDKPEKPVDLTAKAPGHDPDLNLDQRMLRVMQRIGFIPKEGTGPESQGSYRFARVEHIKDAVRDALGENGIMVYASFDGREVQVISGQTRDGNPRTSILATVWGSLTFVNVDDPSQHRTIAIHGQGIDSQDKAIAKATTSADKYGLLNAFQIPTGDDPDAEGEDVPTPPRRASRPQPDQEPPAYANGDAPAGNEGECPKHHRPWKAGQYGFYCSARDESTDKGYCILKPSPEWAAAHER